MENVTKHCSFPYRVVDAISLAWHCLQRSLTRPPLFTKHWPLDKAIVDEELHLGARGITALDVGSQTIGRTGPSMILCTVHREIRLDGTLKTLECRGYATPKEQHLE